MLIEKGRKVSVHYVLRVDSHEGEIVEETEENVPMEFVFGDDPMLPKFEEALKGLVKGDSFSVAIPCAEAYGEEEEDAYMEFPKSEFTADGEWDDELFEIGEVIPMQTPDGAVVQGIVTEVKLNSVVLDFNHPLAGEDLYFTGQVVDVS
jgi:FKBP-type peptidyl-prolyl cis-trans isomerase SlyD